MANDKVIFLFIGGRAFTIAELGPAADMPIDAGMQYIIDNGMLGAEYVGKTWYEVISPNNVNLEAAPDPEEKLSYVLYQKYQDALDECRRLSVNGLLTDQSRELMMKLRRDWLAAKKLSSPD